MGNAIRYEGRQIVRGVAAESVDPGDITTIEDTTGIVIDGGDTGDTIEIVAGWGLTVGFPRAAAAVTAGKRAYLTSAGQVTETSTGNELKGVFAESGDATENADTPVCIFDNIAEPFLTASFKDMTEGTGISGATGEICEHSVTKVGGLIKTEILVDLTGLNSGGTAGDIIGKDGETANCHIGQITAAKNGTIIAGRVTCFETPAGGDPDVDIFSAVEATGAQDAAISTLDETKLIDHGDWTAEDVDHLSALPAADEYLYLVCGDATDADYTAGILLIEMWGK